MCACVPLVCVRVFMCERCICFQRHLWMSWWIALVAVSPALFPPSPEMNRQRKGAGDGDKRCMCLRVCVWLRLHTNVCMLACVMDRGLYERGIG